eukprot:TRINITY_DN39222_c0_g1_i1.p1 TRINITY_DN39222_c0_g1~~TRINITY_DN39222_c0_g1_i1.p1  ORF type:complete len:153 (+),score=28.79 TRINITY_DN39222_c0_g1_i1:129-587(+)
MLRSLVGSEMCIRDSGGSQYLILHPMTSSSNFSLRHQSVLYREYNHLEVQIRRKIVLRRLFYTTTATTATVHLDNIMHTHTTREDADYNTASTSKYVFIISGIYVCLLYTSDAADEEDSVDLGGRRIIKKKNNIYNNRSTNYKGIRRTENGD